MRIIVADDLVCLSLQELTEVVLDRQNTPEIRQAALQRWEALVDQSLPGLDTRATQILNIPAPPDRGNNYPH